VRGALGARGWESPRFQQQIIRTHKSKHKKLKGGMTVASSQIHWSGASCMHGWVHVPDKPNKERALHRHDFPLEKQGEQPSCATDCHMQAM
jgi:hypothetical protein